MSIILGICSDPLSISLSREAVTAPTNASGQAVLPGPPGSSDSAVQPRHLAVLAGDEFILPPLVPEVEHNPIQDPEVNALLAHTTFPSGIPALRPRRQVQAAGIRGGLGGVEGRGQGSSRWRVTFASQSAADRSNGSGQGLRPFLPPSPPPPRPAPPFSPAPDAAFGWTMIEHPDANSAEAVPPNAHPNPPSPLDVSTMNQSQTSWSVVDASDVSDPETTPFHQQQQSDGEGCNGNSDIDDFVIVSE